MQNQQRKLKTPPALERVQEDCLSADQAMRMIQTGGSLLMSKIFCDIIPGAKECGVFLCCAGCCAYEIAMPRECTKKFCFFGAPLQYQGDASAPAGPIQTTAHPNRMI